MSFGRTACFPVIRPPVLGTQPNYSEAGSASWLQTQIKNRDPEISYYTDAQNRRSDAYGQQYYRDKVDELVGDRNRYARELSELSQTGSSQQQSSVGTGSVSRSSHAMLVLRLADRI